MRNTILETISKELKINQFFIGINNGNYFEFIFLQQNNVYTLEEIAND